MTDHIAISKASYSDRGASTSETAVAPSRKATGSHYTPEGLADFVAEQIYGARDEKQSGNTTKILDPAVGDGELLRSILKVAKQNHHTNLQVFGFETTCEALDAAKQRLQREFPCAAITLTHGDFLEFVLQNYGASPNGGLFQQLSQPEFDLIIANPPYVRTQVMGAKQAQRLAQEFGLSGRVDLYYAFILGMGRALRPGGIAGIIVSNRFMTTKSGHDVRLSILDNFDVLHVWDLGDTRLFEAAVLPAVLLLRKKTEGLLPPGPRFTSIYSTQRTNSSTACEDCVSALSKTGVVRLRDGQSFLVRRGRLDCGLKPGEVWRIATEDSDAWLSKVAANTSGTFRDIGRTRVGVKTTADHVFIRSDWEDMPESERPELLKPLATHHIARRFRAVCPERPKQIVYPHHTVDGKRSAVNLGEFPQTARYLNSFRPLLERRRYVAEAGRAWFEIWVPQDPDSWSKPKIVFRDIAQTPTFWMDLQGCVVNGDCYWLACERPEQIDLLWLALAVANSTFVEAYYDHRFHNKLYAGRRRFMTQYVEKFPLPNPSNALARKIIVAAKQIYDLTPSPEAEHLEQELDKMVWQAFDVSPEEVVR